MVQVNIATGCTRVVRRDPSNENVDPSNVNPFPTAGRPVKGTSAPVVDARMGAHRAPASDPTGGRRLRTLDELRLPSGACLVLAAGSVLDYVGDAFVNAANEGCVGGFGLDERVNQAGGDELRKARQALRGCPTGSAKTTASFGHSRTRFIIHAVGPAYRNNPHRHGASAHDARAVATRFAALDALLRDAYRAALREARAHGCRTVGFALLSSGIFRGDKPLADVLEIAVRTLVHALASAPRDAPRVFDTLTLVAYTSEEQAALAEIGARLGAELRQGGSGVGNDARGLFTHFAC